MKLPLAVKTTLLALAVCLATAAIVVLLLHTHFQSLILSSRHELYGQRLDLVLTELAGRNEQFATLADKQTDLKTYQDSVIQDLRRRYFPNGNSETFPAIVDASGTVLLHPCLSGGDRSLQPIFPRDIGPGQRGLVEMAASDNEHLVFYSHFPPWDWLVCWFVPKKSPTGAFDTLPASLLAILLASFMVMGLLLLYFTTMMLKPLSVLTRQVNAFAAGDMGPYRQLDRQDEIGALAGAFVKMQEEMQEKINQLNSSEKKYRELIQHANFVILRWDKDGRILYLNEYGRRLFGFNREELLGQHVVGTIVARTESTSGRDLSAMIDEILLHPDDHAINENENLCKDGSRVWIQWNNNAILDDKGRFIEMLSVGTNITERRKAEHHLWESESRYRALFESANDAILIRDENGICIDCNAKALELFGCSRTRLIGSPPHLITPATQPDGENSAVRAEELITSALAGEPQSLEWQIRRHDGEIRDVHARVSSFAVNEKKYVQSVLTDITRQKRMEVELRQAQKMEGIGTLAGGIAHDFNNILSAIIGYTELAQMKINPNSELAMDLNQVRKASERARGLVRQILTFSRKQKHDDSVLQINLIVKEALKLIRSSIPATIEMEQNLSCRAAVRTDPTLIHQLIMNLCTNAFQAMEETGGKLTVSMSEVVIDRTSPYKTKNLPAGKYVHIEVGDTGCGMKRDIMDKIFDPFFTTKEQGRGTGLGLAVVHDIVQDLSGGITVESEPGSGTTFRVFLPAAENQGDPHNRHNGNELSSRGSERIMVVDDEAAIRDLTQSILTKSGYRVDLFGDGKAALQAFSRAPHLWNLIITDQTMPKMTGVELAVRAMKIRTGMPVIICTGYSETISVEKAHELGIRTYLHKPVSLNELLAAVHEALANT